MMFDYSLAGLVALGLLFYLTYALLRPERFERSMLTLIEVVLAFVVTSALLIALIHLLLPARKL